MKLIHLFVRWLKKVFWTKPTESPNTLLAKDVVHHQVVINYKGQNICLNEIEVPMFEAMSRLDKRGMAKKFKELEEKGQLKFKKVQGQMIAVKTPLYDNSRNVRKPRYTKTGS